MNRLILSTLVIAGLAAAVPASMAQSGVAAPAAKPQHAFRMPGERIEARLAYIRTALNITGAQQTQWDAFAGVMRRQAQEADARIRAYREQRVARTVQQRPNAIERLERRQQRLDMAAKRLGERLAVQKPLYAALSPEQRQIADEVFAGRGGHGGRRGGRPGRA